MSAEQPEEANARNAVLARAADVDAVDLSALFASDPERVDHFSVTAADWWIDLSKNRIDDEGLGRLAHVEGIIGPEDLEERTGQLLANE